MRDTGLEAEGKVQYLVETSNGFKIPIATYHDLREEEDFDALVHFGKSPSPTRGELGLKVKVVRRTLKG